MVVVEIPKVLKEEVPRWLQVFLKAFARIIKPPTYLFPATLVWEYYPLIRHKEVILPGEKLVLYDRIASGWLFYAFGVCNDPDLIFCIDIYGEGAVEIRLSPRRMYELGHTQPNIKGFWLSRYDDVEKVYVVNYTPQGLGAPFREYNKFWLENPTDRAILLEYLFGILILLR